ncbi:MAG TPA: GNAT family N-acetyltransferase [Ignavibacteria bacterium]|nr:GNAT family N-acetyltransferase [Ignavibacteria bacterium]
MTRKDLDIAIEWAAQEGWNPGLKDADCFYQTDPNGFFIGELDGEPISTISAVKYGNEFGFIGFYIVKNEFRGHGYGHKIWQVASDYLKDICSGLDGVVAQQASYESHGYVKAFNQFRFEEQDVRGARESEILDIKNIPFEKIFEYDNHIVKYNRKTFLNCWLNMEGTYACGIMRKDKNDKVVGYGLIRHCRNGFKIGPLFADDFVIAEKIYLALADYATGNTVYLDVPEANKMGLELAKKYVRKYVFETARMYKNGFLNQETGKIFGVTTFELG